jgi:L-fuculose-phosphate aldolase
MTTQGLWLLREELCSISAQMERKGFIAGNDGNISVRLEDGNFLITPTGVRKSDLKPEELLIADPGGEVLDGPDYLRLTSEFRMHLRIYEVRPDINAVCHAHPPTATGFALARKSLAGNYLPEIIFFMEQPGYAPYGTPGTHKLADSIEATAKQSDAFLMANHGAVGSGSNLKLAWWNLERLEHLAKIVVAAKSAGGAKEISDSQVREILVQRPD